MQKTENVNISIHAPRTGSDASEGERFSAIDISIHAPRTGSNIGNWEYNYIIRYFNPRSPHGERLRCKPAFSRIGVFQSTLPARGATVNHFSLKFTLFISIHAPRTGSDAQGGAGLRRPADFNPRSPHGERHENHQARHEAQIHFNPRSPHGERQS